MVLFSRSPKSLVLMAALWAVPMIFGASAGEQVRERVYRMTEFFDTMLPGTLQAHNVTLHFTPKFSDFRDEQYVRYPLELRYGLNEHWELSSGIVPFGPNPFRTGRDHRWGPG